MVLLSVALAATLFVELGWAILRRRSLLLLSSTTIVLHCVLLKLLVSQLPFENGFALALVCYGEVLVVGIAFVLLEQKFDPAGLPSSKRN